MKKQIIAFTLSFFLPGAGLAYLGKWKWCFINLSIVFAIGVACALILPEKLFNKYIQYVAIGLGGGSGGLAQALAKQMSSHADSKPST